MMFCMVVRTASAVRKASANVILLLAESSRVLSIHWVAYSFKISNSSVFHNTPKNVNPSSDLSIETAGLQSHEMPGQTANPLTPHRVPFISHRTASYLGLLKRLLHFLMGGKGKKEVLSLRPSCWRGVECLCRSCEQKQQRTRALPDNLCPPMKQLSRSSD